MGWFGVDRRIRAAWLRYGAALTMVLAATLLSVLFRPLLAAAPVVIFLAAVALSAWLGGTGPAVAAIVRSLAGISLAAMAPVGSWSLAQADVRAMGVFLLAALLLVFLSERRDKTDAALQARDDRLRDALEHARQAETTVAQARARAEALFVSPNTVKSHVASLLAKLHAESRAQLAAMSVWQELHHQP